MIRSLSAFVLGVLALVCGIQCNGKTTDELLPLPDDEAEKHEAPRADGECRKLRDEPDSWLTKLDAYDLAPRENLRLSRDPCGNTLVTWTEVRRDEVSQGTNALVRLMRDGVIDWGVGSRYAPLGLQAGTNPVLVVDHFGNAVLLTNQWLQVFAPNGRLHPTMPVGGIGPGGTGLAAQGDQWLVEGPTMRLIQLPSGNIHLERPENNHASPYRHSFIGVDDQRAIWNQVVNVFEDGDFIGTEIYCFERTPEDSRSLFFLGVDNFAEAALLATNGKRTFLGSTYYAADPMTLERIECSESVLIDIDNEDWKPDAPSFCGAIEAIALVEDSLFSLWSVPVPSENPDHHPFEATPILLRHDLEGRETGSFELEETVGRTHQDGTGALDMVVTNDGKAVVVGILSGGSWNGRYFTYPSSVTVAKIALD